MKRRLPAVIFFSIFSISASPRGIFAYELDVHFVLTMFLAEHVGLDSSRAAELANYDQFTDDDPETSPFGSIYARRSFHFVTASRHDKLYGIVMKSCKSQDFGWFSHAAADKFSHSGYGSILGHLTGGHGPDKTYNALETALDMAVVKFHRIVKIVQKCWPKQLKRNAWDAPLESTIEGFFRNTAEGLLPAEKLRLLGGTAGTRYVSAWQSYEDWKSKALLADIQLTPLDRDWE